MATLAIAKDFLADYGELQKPVQRKVQELFVKFAEDSTAPGLHLEHVRDAADPRARTVRVDQAYRGVVAAPEQGDTYILVSVLHHDDAYRWVASKKFNVNQLTGALEIYDLTDLEAAAGDDTGAEDRPAEGRLFDGVPDKALRQLGVPEELTPLVRRLDSDVQLDAFTTLLPSDQGDALAMLAAGYSPEEAYAELVAGEPIRAFDPDDLGAAVRRPSSSARFYVVDGAEDLTEQLAKPLSLWRIFLHPTQRRYAYRDHYNGPARITGGAGTGKTVVALHRTHHLVDRAGDQSPRVLLTTFTRNLAAALRGQLELLGGPDLADAVEVTNVDALANRLVREAEGTSPGVCRDEEARDAWAQAVDEVGLALPAEFVAKEWEQVVLAQGLYSRDDYFRAPRAGRGLRLSRRQRAQVWEAVETFGNLLADRGQRTFLQLADAAAGYAARQRVTPFDHIVVDEAQDLHPAQWRMLRALVAAGPDDLFIVGDTHQRIYDRRVSLSGLGIEIRGRSHRLRLNYRTTQEILRWSLALLRGETFDDLDGGEEHLDGYRSELRGPPPVVKGYTGAREELDALAEAIRQWGEQGIDPGEVGVAARTNQAVDDVCAALENHGIDATRIDPSRPERTGDAVAVGTMHRMKGLEYRAVATIDVSHNKVPLPWLITPESDDPLQYRRDLQQERCLLYVACTRAREQLRVSWRHRPSELLPQ